MATGTQKRETIKPQYDLSFSRCLLGYPALSIQERVQVIIPAIGMIPVDTTGVESVQDKPCFQTSKKKTEEIFQMKLLSSSHPSFQYRSSAMNCDALIGVVVYRGADLDVRAALAQRIPAISHSPGRLALRMTIWTGQ